MSQLKASIGAFFESYKGTEKRVKMIDVYLLFTLATAVAQFVYCSLVGTFPFNSFLSGFGCALGAFVLGVSLRMQMTSAEFETRSKERAFADFVVCNVVLFLVVTNFMG